MTDSQTTTKTYEARYTGAGDDAGWKVLVRWYDEQGRRCTNFVAQTYEQAGDPGSAERNARMIAEALNG